MELVTKRIQNIKLGNVDVCVGERRFWRLDSILITSKTMRLAGKMYGIPPSIPHSNQLYGAK
jgi:hypothetical protein